MQLCAKISCQTTLNMLMQVNKQLFLIKGSLDFIRPFLLPHTHIIIYFWLTWSNYLQTSCTVGGTLEISQSHKWYNSNSHFVKMLHVMLEICCSTLWHCLSNFNCDESCHYSYLHICHWLMSSVIYSAYKRGVEIRYHTSQLPSLQSTIFKQRIETVSTYSSCYYIAPI